MPQPQSNSFSAAKLEQFGLGKSEIDAYFRQTGQAHREHVFAPQLPLNAYQTEMIKTQNEERARRDENSNLVSRLKSGASGLLNRMRSRCGG